MIRVVTGSRLHFGLFHLPACDGELWPDRQGEPRLPARRFGGVGMMIESPGVELTVSPAATWSTKGPLAERALAFARRLAQSLPGMTSPCHIQIDRCAPEHAGLGTGTQLGLAVARALAAVNSDAGASALDLARRVGRGARSALGVHGFAHGGFLVESGQRAPDALAPLVCRAAFPTHWRLLLILPQSGSGLHGGLEREAFAALPPMPEPTTNVLCRLALLGMLPAIQEEDICAFGDAVHDFNARVGEAFAPVQNCTYASSVVASLVEFLRQLGVRGVGQSSWGPAVFAVVRDDEEARFLARQIQMRFTFTPEEVIVTRGRNVGASCLEE